MTPVILNGKDRKRLLAAYEAVIEHMVSVTTEDDAESQTILDLLESRYTELRLESGNAKSA